MRHGKRIPETQSGVLFCNLHESHTEAIIDFRFRDADSGNYDKEVMDTLFPRG